MFSWKTHYSHVGLRYGFTKRIFGEAVQKPGFLHQLSSRAALAGDDQDTAAQNDSHTFSRHTQQRRLFATGTEWSGTPRAVPLSVRMHVGLQNRMQALLDGADRRWMSEALSEETLAYNKKIELLRAQRDLQGVSRQFDAMKRHGIPCSAQTYTLVLETICQERSRGTPLTKLIAVYQESLQANILLSAHTISLIIEALCDRRQEVRHAREEADNVHAEANGEKSLELGLDIFFAALDQGVKLDTTTYDKLLQTLDYEGDYVRAFRVFNALKNQKTSPSQNTYSAMISLCGKSGDIDAAAQFLEDYRSKCRELQLDLRQRGMLAPYDAYVRVLVESGRVADAERAVGSIYAEDGIVPSPFAYLPIIRHHVARQEMGPAEAWYARAKASGMIHGFAAISSAMLSGYAQAENVEKSLGILRDASATPRYLELERLITLAIAKKEHKAIIEVLSYIANEQSLDLRSSIAEAVQTELASSADLDLYRLGSGWVLRGMRQPQAKLNFVGRALKSTAVASPGAYAALYAVFPQHGIRVDPICRAILSSYTAARAQPHFLSQLTNRRDAEAMFEAIGAAARKMVSRASDEHFAAISSDMEVLGLVPSEALVSARRQHQQDFSAAGGRQAPIKPAAPAKVDREGVHRLSGRICNTDELDQMMAAYYKIQDMGAFPTVPAVSKLISALSRAGDIESVFELVRDIERMVGANHADEMHNRALLSAYNAVIISLCKHDRASEAFGYVDKIAQLNRSPSAAAYTELLLRMSPSAETVQQGMSMLHKMVMHNVRVTSYFCNVLLQKLKAVVAEHPDAVGKAEDVLSHMFARTIPREHITYGTLMSIHLAVGNAARAKELYARMKGDSCEGVHQQGAYHVVMGHFVEEGDREGALQVLEDMKARAVTPNAITFLYHLRAYLFAEPVDFGRAEALLLEMKRFGLQPNGLHYKEFVHAYTLRDDFDRALEWLERMNVELEKNGPSFEQWHGAYELIMQSYARIGDESKARRFREIMDRWLKRRSSNPEAESTAGTAA